MTNSKVTILAKENFPFNFEFSFVLTSATVSPRLLIDLYHFIIYDIFLDYTNKIESRSSVLGNTNTLSTVF